MNSTTILVFLPDHQSAFPEPKGQKFQASERETFFLLRLHLKLLVLVEDSFYMHNKDYKTEKKNQQATTVLETDFL